MKAMRLQYSIPNMTRVLDVSASGYYAWLERSPSKRDNARGLKTTVENRILKKCHCDVGD